jgi:hypothetical protein
LNREGQAGAAWDAGREFGMAVSANRAAADVLRDYRAAIEDSDRAIRAVGDPEARFTVPVDGTRHTLRWVMAHMTSENRPARRTRRHPPRTARRHYRPLNPASTAIRVGTNLSQVGSHTKVEPQPSPPLTNFASIACQAQ